MRKPFILFAVLASALLSGCVSTHVEMPNGVKLDRTALFNKTGIGKIKFNPTAGAFEMTGYANDQTELAAAVTEAAVRGATQKQ